MFFEKKNFFFAGIFSLVRVMKIRICPPHRLLVFFALITLHSLSIDTKIVIFVESKFWE